MRWRSVGLRLGSELAYYRAVIRDPRTPRVAKVLMGLAIAYLLSPVDLIPDFVPVLGQLDDAVLVPALIWLALALVPAPVKADARRASRRA